MRSSPCVWRRDGAVAPAPDPPPLQGIHARSAATVDLAWRRPDHAALELPPPRCPGHVADPPDLRHPKPTALDSSSKERRSRGTWEVWRGEAKGRSRAACGQRGQGEKLKSGNNVHKKYELTST